MDFIVFQTYTVYLLLALVMIAMCWMSARTKRDGWMIAAIAVYAFVFAMRYGVGVDSMAYLKSYLSASNGLIDKNFDRWEPLFKGVSYFLATSGCHHSIFYFVWAFVPLFCVFKLVKDHKAVYPYLAFVFMFGAIWLNYANGLRQIAAFGFVALSIPYLYNRQIWKYIFCVVLAILCHKSALVLVVMPLIYVRRKTYFNNRMTQFIALGVALVLMNINLAQDLWQQFDLLITYLDYGFYEHTEFMEMQNLRLGAGFYISLAINIMLIYWSNLMKRTYPNSVVPMIYDLNFVGTLLYYAFLRVQIIGRINYYFYGFNYIIGALTLLALVRNRKPYGFIVIAGLYLFVFIATLHRMEDNTALYRFYWEVFGY